MCVCMGVCCVWVYVVVNVGVWVCFVGGASIKSQGLSRADVSTAINFAFTCVFNHSHM